MNRLLADAWRSLNTLALAAIVAALLAVPAQADERVAPEDLARIAEALQAAGYDSFEDIEFDDDGWEVENAAGSDGVEYDLKLDPQTMEIVGRERD